MCLHIMKRFSNPPASLYPTLQHLPAGLQLPEGLEIPRLPLPTVPVNTELHTECMVPEPQQLLDRLKLMYARAFCEFCTWVLYLLRMAVICLLFSHIFVVSYVHIHLAMVTRTEPVFGNYTNTTGTTLNNEDFVCPSNHTNGSNHTEDPSSRETDPSEDLANVIFWSVLRTGFNFFFKIKE